MQIVGYNKEDVFVDFLKETTITCSYDELKTIIDFLNFVANECDDSNPECCCLHLRDFNKNWKTTSSDLIILIP